MMLLLRTLLLSLFILFIINQVHSDLAKPCDFSKTYSSLYELKECLPYIPANRQMISNIVDAALATADMYSFEYLAMNSSLSGSPYKISVNMKKEIEPLRNKPYKYDYLFHKDLMNIFFRLYDTHTLYIPPEPYKTSSFLFPFDVNILYYNNQQMFVVNSDSAQYLSITGKQSGAVGKRIKSINGKDPVQFYTEMAQTLHTSKDLAPRFNTLLQTNGMALSYYIIPDFDYLQYVFHDGSVLNLPILVKYYKTVSGVESFKKLLETPIPSQKRKVRQAKYKMGPLLAIDPRLLIPEIPKHFTKTAPKNTKLRESGLLQTVYTASDESVTYYYHPQLQISIFKFRSFVPFSKFGSNPWDEFRHIVQLGVSHAQFMGVSQLIFDVQGNPGGYMCIALQLLSYFIKEYSEISKVFQPFEIKKNKIVDSAQDLFFTPSALFNITTFKTMTNNQFYTNSVVKKLGGVSANYSQQYYYDCAAQGDFYFGVANHFFNKIILLTDGNCGSACSIFSSKLTVNKKVVAVNVGGYDSLFDISSYNGGTVLQYAYLVENGAPIPAITKSNAEFSVNVLHMYTSVRESLPREYQKIPGLIKLNTWAFNDLEGLVDMVAPLFYQMEPIQ